MKREAGPELDVRLAEKLMGWRRADDGDWLDADGGWTGWVVEDGDPAWPTWAPSANLTAAWQVVGRLRDLFPDYTFELTPLHHHYEARLTRARDIDVPDGTEADDREALYAETAPTVPHAICLVALAALESGIQR